MTGTTVYPASPIKRSRATRAEIETRAEFLIDYAEEHGPVTVRGLYYQAEVHGMPGIDKDDKGYAKIQRQVLNLRRAGRLAYETSLTPPDGCGSRGRTIASRTPSRRPPGPTAAACGRDADDVCRGLVREGRARRRHPSGYDLFDVPLMVARGFPRRHSASRRSPLAATMTGPIMSTTWATSIAPAAMPPVRSRKSWRGSVTTKTFQVVFERSPSRSSRSRAWPADPAA